MRSMTGFGRAEGQSGPNLFTVEIKSVNHRFLDARFRLPGSLTIYESHFSERLRALFERGSFEINIKHKVAPTGPTVSTGTRYVVDELAARSLVQSCEWVKSNLGVTAPLSLDVFALSNRVFIAVEETQDTESLLVTVKEVFDRALQDLKEMRSQEGLKLKQILKEGISNLTALVKKLDQLAPEQPKRIFDKLKQRLGQWNLSAPIDPQRLEVEAALYAERSDITEELDRLRTHAAAFLKTLEAGTSIGRRLDFLTQELHREVNTLGAKASMVEITQCTVEAKAIVEKLREQVQNVE